MLNILLVLGNQTGIEEPIQEADIITKYCGNRRFLVNIEPLPNPTRNEFYEKIQSQSFDVIIIVGHMAADNDGLDGSITINNLPLHNSISIHDFTGPFQSSVMKGLKLVILAGCSSDAAARALVDPTSQINVPTVIGFRRPIHYIVVRRLLLELFRLWISELQSLEMAFTNTKKFLNICDNDCPGAATTPIIFHSHREGKFYPPLMFLEISRSSLYGRCLEPLLSSSLVIQLLNRDSRLTLRSFIELAAIVSLLIFSFYIYQYIEINRQISVQNSPQQLQAACVQNNPDISCGERILLPVVGRGENPDKLKAANLIKNGDYPGAITSLSKIKQDPEASIMLENAKLKSTESQNIKSIVVTMPGIERVSIQILQAAAFFQKEWNNNKDHAWKLQIVLMNDRNDTITAGDLVKNIIKRDVVAVIGHYSSKVTLAIKDTYENVVLISATSTAIIEPNKTNDQNKHPFFRVCSTSDIQVDAIVKKWAGKYNNIALFHTKDSPFSDTMTKAFKKHPEIKIVSDFNFEGKHPAKDDIEQARTAGAQAIVLFPDAYTSTNPEKDRSASIIKANNGEFPIVGNEIITDLPLFGTSSTFTKTMLQNLTVLVPWHPSTNLSTYDNPKIKEELAEAWKTWGSKDQLNHRTALTYDAIKTIVFALDKLHNDNSIDILKKIPGVIATNSVQGITGLLHFNGSERINPIGSLIKPKCKSTCEGFESAELVSTSNK
jgi:ABC-type branched-subunit amino acid transport system substrate-binding protein